MVVNVYQRVKNKNVNAYLSKNELGGKNYQRINLQVKFKFGPKSPEGIYLVLPKKEGFRELKKLFKNFLIFYFI